MKRKHVQRVLCALMSGVFLTSSAASPLAGTVSMAAEASAAEETAVYENAENTGEVASEAPVDEVLSSGEDATNETENAGEVTPEVSDEEVPAQDELDETNDDSPKITGGGANS
nr:hypothetical protein [uncultured Blautia sp.]